MKRLRIVVSLITQDNDFQMEQAASAEEAALRLGVDVEIIYADNDSIEQSQQVLKFVQSDADAHPDGVILEPVGGTALPKVAQAAASTGIAWVVLNRDVDYIRQLRKSYKTPAFGVSTDNLQVGRIQGQQMAALLPKGGSVLYVQGPAESDASKLRNAGMYETRPASIEVKTIKGDWTDASAFKAVSSWLRLSTSQQSHIDVIAAQNDAMALGTKRALQEFAFDGESRERWLAIPLLGCDGVPQTGQAWVRSGLLAATIITPPLAGTALEMLVHALKTGTNPQELTLVAPGSFPNLNGLTAVAIQKTPIASPRPFSL